MRIAIVNDVPAIVFGLKQVIGQNPDYEVCWTAGDGAEAVAKCAADTPDLILMDLLMPVMDGTEATRKIMDSSPCAILVVTASVTGNAAKVFEAMGAGALDAISTPSFGFDGSSDTTDFHRKIENIGRLISRSQQARSSRAAPLQQSPSLKHPPLIAIGSSTGGPAALARILAQLPQDLPAAVVVIQHVDSQFAKGLAEWLDQQTPLKVRLADNSDFPRRGEVLIAGTSHHLVLKAGGRLSYNEEPRDYVYRPSVDVFFESAVAHWPNRVVGVLLTGMGRDGALGLQSLRRRGMHTIAQDKDTCAVYGMPKAAVELNAADRILPVQEIAEALINAICIDHEMETGVVS